MKPDDEGRNLQVERERSAATIREATADARFSPRDFLRARRPERFSDSVVDDEPILDRSILEYHLETLTNRSQEADFARFAYKLASREVCPNLLPQTGPTGGGDSKVDTETYPCNTTKPTVARALQDLEKLGIAQEVTGKPRHRLYVYRQYLDILNRDAAEHGVAAHGSSRRR